MDGVDALEKTRTLKPDLIVLDFSMPRMNGLQAASVIQSIAPKTPIIMFTLHKEEVSSGAAHDCGISSVLSKTERLSLLYEEMQRLSHPVA